jgi:glutathionylspermidine synthase
MLPTYLEPDPSGSFVLKPAFGSGGDSVVVSDGTRRFTSSGSTYAEGHMVYQQLVPVPNTVVATEAGVMELNAVASCYLVSQAPAGVIFRYGTGITNNSWWVVPVATAQGAGA